MKRSTQTSVVPPPTIKDEDAEDKVQTKKTKRSDLTPNACTRCRSKKSKCDGTRPICSRCQKDDAICVFDVGDGMTRMQGLQQQLDQRNVDHERLMIFMNALQHGSDDLATLLLARLRIGESIEQLVTSIESGEHLPVVDQQEELPRLEVFPGSQHGLWPDLNPQDLHINTDRSPTIKSSPSPR